MEFVFSFWYIIMILLVLGIVACLVVFFMMDKKDRVLIDNFIKESTANSQSENETTADKVEETAQTEEVKE